MPDTFSLVVNSNHPLVNKILSEKEKSVNTKLQEFDSKIKPLETEKQAIADATKDKKPEEISQADKDKKAELETSIHKITDERKQVLETYGKENKLVKQLIDLALLSNNMLKGEELTKFVKRNIELIK